ncbi:TPA: helix-turn-helix transcriptional regulator [Pseudomonas aeruginosa]|nr:helix-turn-helix transcriptional regulator [Pseudomonas aeruginosa]
METKKPFGQALRLARLKKGLLQENFESVSSRQTISFLERGGSSVTLQKLDDLCSVLDIHPATLVALTYLLGDGPQKASSDEIVKIISKQLKALEHFQDLLNQSQLQP